MSGQLSPTFSSEYQKIPRQDTLDHEMPENAPSSKLGAALWGSAQPVTATYDENSILYKRGVVAKHSVKDLWNGKDGLGKAARVGHGIKTLAAGVDKLTMDFSKVLGITFNALQLPFVTTFVSGAISLIVRPALIAAALATAIVLAPIAIVAKYIEKPAIAVGKFLNKYVVQPIYNKLLKPIAKFIALVGKKIWNGAKNAAKFLNKHKFKILMGLGAIVATGIALTPIGLAAAGVISFTAMGFIYMGAAITASLGLNVVLLKRVGNLEQKVQEMTSGASVIRPAASSDKGVLGEAFQKV